MQVVLLKDVKKVGKKYEEKSVASGYADNFLIPNGLAEVLTSRNKKKFDTLRAQESATLAKQEEALAKHFAKLEETPLNLSGKANDKGHLFAGIHKDVLAQEISKIVGAQIASEFIELDKPLKEVGEHSVSLKVGEKSAKIKVVISAKAE